MRGTTSRAGGLVVARQEGLEAMQGDRGSNNSMEAGGGKARVARDSETNISSNIHVVICVNANS